MSETDDNHIKRIKLMIENLNMAKLLNDYKLVKAFNKEFKKTYGN